MTYEVLDKIPRKYDFTKNRWSSVNYEKLEDKDLNSKIKEIDEDSKDLLSLPKKYENFLIKFELLLKEFDSKTDIVQKFYNENLIRKSRVEEVTEFIFFKHKVDEHDVYFPNKGVENEFFKLFEELAEIFLKKKKLYDELDEKKYRYLFPASNEKYVKLYGGNWYGGGPILNKINPEFNDIEKYSNSWKSEAQKKNFSYQGQARTIRTYELFERMWGVTLKYNLRNAHIPYLPEVSYVKWYFNKIVDENNRLRRRIELVLRSRKRSVELATNLNSIYIFSNKSYSKNTYKIGWTTGLPEDRADQLSSETGVLHPFKVMYSKQFKDAEKRERQIHKHFNEYRVRKNKEYFDLDLKKIINYIDSIKEEI